MDSLDNFPKDLKEKSGGFIIVDKIEEDKVILLGKSNITNKGVSYENFGGRYEKEDICSLHTGVRELIEEFFNLKVPVNVVNIIAYGLRTNNLIIKQHELNGMAYLINFDGLNFIFQQFVIWKAKLLMNLSPFLNESDKYRLKHLVIQSYIKYLMKSSTGNFNYFLNKKILLST